MKPQLLLSLVLSVAIGCSTPTSESKGEAQADSPKTEQSDAEKKTLTDDQAPPNAPSPKAMPSAASKEPGDIRGPAGVPKLPQSRFKLRALRAKKLVPTDPIEPPDLTEKKEIGPSTKAELRQVSEAAIDGNVRQQQGAPPIRKINDHTFEVGRILVDQKARQIVVKTEVNLTEGILEYFAVGPSGKTHESVLTYVGLPSHVHIGLILLGLDPKRKRGPLLRLTVRWKDPVTKQLKKAPAEYWLYDRTLKVKATAQKWRFTGSVFWRGRYSGDSSQILVSTIPDQSAVIELDSEAGNPYRGADLGFEVNQVSIPPKGTLVDLIIEPTDNPSSK